MQAGPRFSTVQPGRRRQMGRSGPLGAATLRTIVVVALLSGWQTAEAMAQVWVGSSGPRRGAVEISGGGIWTAGQDLSSGAAVLTGNPAAGGSGDFELFSSDPSLKAVIGAQALVGVYVTRTLAIEGGVQFSRPTLSVRLSDDFEGAPDITATTEITQYLFSGSLVYHFGNAGRTVPFIAAGAGHIRDVHAFNELVETGTEYHAIAGVKMWLGGSRRRFGLRAEGGVSMRSGGFNFDEDRRTVPTAALSLTYLY